MTMRPERWHQIDSILKLALDREGEARSAFLDAACGNDRELRSEVEALLAHDEIGLDLLDRTSGLLAEKFMPLKAGDLLGPWRLGRQLGEGGAGVVFEGQRADGAYERQVAIKILKQVVLSARSVERFRAECRVLARLEHPDIARLYDTGVTETGFPYLVLELVRGSRLDHWRARTKPSLRDRLRLFSRVCDSVAYSHRNLVIHRDLKPSNILVTESGGPKLLDFGIAKILRGDGEHSTLLTRTHEQPMTPQYASPEQLRGGEASTASDVYSLGLILYELLTGELPYRMDLGRGEIARQLISDNLSLPLASDTAALSGASQDCVRSQDLRGDLDTILVKALEVDEGRRYGAALELREEIERYLQGLPIRARAPSAAYVAKRFIGRHRLGAATAVLFLLVILGSSIGLTLTAQRLVVERDRAENEAATTREVVRFLGGLFEGASPEFHRGTELTARQLLDRGAEDWESTTDLPPKTRAALATAIGKAYLDLSLFSKARQFVESAMALTPLGGDSNTGPLAQLLAARLEWSESNFSEAVREAESSLAVLRRRGNPKEVAEALALLGRSAGSAGDLTTAERALEEALSLLDSSDPQLLGLRNVVLRDLGAVHLYRHEIGAAKEKLEPALEGLIAAYGSLHPEVFEGRRLLAAMAENVEDLVQGQPVVAYLEDLLKDQQALYGESHQQLVWTLLALGADLVRSHRTQEAVLRYSQAAAMQDRLFGEDHFGFAVIHAGLGVALDRQGDLSGAIESFRKSLAISRLHVAADSRDLAMPKIFLGEALAKAGHCQEALLLLREAAETMQQAERQASFMVLRSNWSEGYSLACLGEVSSGVELMQQSITAAEELGYSKTVEREEQVKRWREELGRWSAGIEPVS